MTNAQKWIIAFLGLFILLFVFGRLTKNDEDTQTSTLPEGMKLINSFGCTKCHGSDLRGTTMAPSLLAINNFWTRDNLINYLSNPSSYNGDNRIEAFKKQYNSIMPAFGNHDEEELGKIADHLLTLK